MNRSSPSLSTPSSRTTPRLPALPLMSTAPGSLSPRSGSSQGLSPRSPRAPASPRVWLQGLLSTVVSPRSIAPVLEPASFLSVQDRLECLGQSGQAMLAERHNRLQCLCEDVDALAHAEWQPGQLGERVDDLLHQIRCEADAIAIETDRYGQRLTELWAEHAPSPRESSGAQVLDRIVVFKESAHRRLATGEERTQTALQTLHALRHLADRSSPGKTF